MMTNQEVVKHLHRLQKQFLSLQNQHIMLGERLRSLEPASVREFFKTQYQCMQQALVQAMTLVRDVDNAGRRWDEGDKLKAMAESLEDTINSLATSSLELKKRKRREIRQARAT